MKTSIGGFQKGLFGTVFLTFRLHKSLLTTSGLPPGKFPLQLVSTEIRFEKIGFRFWRDRIPRTTKQ